MVMKILSFKNLSAFLVTMVIASSTAIAVPAQAESENTLIAQRAVRETKEFQGNKPPTISNAGLLNAARDHYFDVLVSGDSLNRLEVQCVTYHELDDVKVLDPASGEEIPHAIDFGFEEFIVTFDEAVPVGQEVRIVMEGSSVRGVTTGVIVPYRIFGESTALGTIPLGTALVRGATEN